MTTYTNPGIIIRVKSRPTSVNRSHVEDISRDERRQECVSWDVPKKVRIPNASRVVKVLGSVR